MVLMIQIIRIRPYLYYSYHSHELVYLYLINKNAPRHSLASAILMKTFFYGFVRTSIKEIGFMIAQTPLDCQIQQFIILRGGAP